MGKERRDKDKKKKDREEKDLKEKRNVKCWENTEREREGKETKWRKKIRDKDGN